MTNTSALSFSHLQLQGRTADLACRCSIARGGIRFRPEVSGIPLRATDLCQEGLAVLAPSSDGFVRSTLVQGPSCSSPAGQEHPGVQRLLHVLNSLNLILSSQQ